MLIWDLESDGLLGNVTKVHCIAILDTHTGVNTLYDPLSVPFGIAALQHADCICGHNIIGYDLPVLEKLYGFKPTGTVIDTLVMSRTAYRDLLARESSRCKAGVKPGSHALESWGVRLGFPKGDYGKQEDAWDHYTEEMGEYCKQDVEVTRAVYEHLAPQLPDKAVQLECDFATIISRQERYGFPFNAEEASLLYSDLCVRHKEIEIELINSFSKGWFKFKEEKVSKVNNKKIGYTKGAPYSKVEWTPFNPGSREHLAKCMVENGWKPTVKTPTGKPQVDEKTIKTYKGPGASIIQEYLDINKSMSMVATGKQAWLTQVKDGRIHGRVNTGGAVTGRCTHSNPNVAQVPADSRFRKLWHPGEGRLLVGADASGLELRCLAHYMGDEKYIDTLLNADIHTANQEAAGLPTRDNAKTFILMLG